MNNISELKYTIVIRISKKFNDTNQLKENPGEGITLTVMIHA